MTSGPRRVLTSSSHTGPTLAITTGPSIELLPRQPAHHSTLQPPPSGAPATLPPSTPQQRPSAPQYRTRSQESGGKSQDSSTARLRPRLSAFLLSLSLPFPCHHPLNSSAIRRERTETETGVSLNLTLPSLLLSAHPTPSRHRLTLVTRSKSNHSCIPGYLQAISPHRLPRPDHPLCAACYGRSTARCPALGCWP